MTSPTIRRFASATPPAIGALVDAADEEGHPFVRRTLDEWAAGENRFDRPNEAFFLAELNGEVVGTCGINRDHHVDDPTVGRLRHLYVHPTQRGTGLGADLVARCLDHAVGRFHLVRLRTPGAAADRFYDNLGFDRSASDTATHELVPPAR